MSNSSIWPIDKNLSGARTPNQSGPESNGNEAVLRINFLRGYIISSILNTNNLLTDLFDPKMGP